MLFRRKLDAFRTVFKYAPITLTIIGRTNSRKPEMARPGGILEKPGHQDIQQVLQAVHMAFLALRIELEMVQICYEVKHERSSAENSTQEAYNGPVDESQIPARNSGVSAGNKICASTEPAPAD